MMGVSPLVQMISLFPPKGLATEGHPVGELAMSHRPLVSWVEDLAMAGDERGY